MSNIDISTNISKDKLKEIHSLLQNIALERRKHIESDIVLKNIIIDITHESNNRNSIFIQKIRDIVLRRELLNCLKISDTNEVSVLDVRDFLNVELTYEEQQQLKSLLEEKLQQKEDLLIQDVNEISDLKIHEVNEILEQFKFDSELENNKIRLEEDKLKEINNKVIETTVNLGKELTELVNLRNNVVPKVIENKTTYLMLENQKLNLRVKIVEIQSEVLIFKDSSMTLQAYKIAYQDMKDRQEKYLNENNNIKSDLEKFKILLRNKEFEEILHNYKQYVESIKKLKWLNNEVLKK